MAKIHPIEGRPVVEGPVLDGGLDPDGADLTEAKRRSLLG